MLDLSHERSWESNHLHIIVPRPILASRTERTLFVNSGGLVGLSSLRPPTQAHAKLNQLEPIQCGKKQRQRTLAKRRCSHTGCRLVWCLQSAVLIRRVSISEPRRRLCGPSMRASRMRRQRAVRHQREFTQSITDSGKSSEAKEVAERRDVMLYGSVER